VVGAHYGDNDGLHDAGSAYIFKRKTAGWAQTKKLTAGNAVKDARFGEAVSISDNLKLIGAPYQTVSGFIAAGAAYVYGGSSGTAKSLIASSANEPIPETFALRQNYPNPFSPLERGTFGKPETEIGFGLPSADHVTVKIFNLLGQEIRTLGNDKYAAGLHHVRWDGKDNDGNTALSGIYFYQLQAGAFSQVKKMSLLR